MVIFKLLVLSYIYAHYPIYFFLLFEQYYQVLCCVKIQKKSLNLQVGVWHISKYRFFRLFMYGGRVRKRHVKFCHPLQVANLSMLLGQNSPHYVNIMTIESILGVFLFKTGMFQRIKN